MQSEYIIWGVAPNTDFETLLVSEHAGISTRAQAERVVATLTDVHGCRACRIQLLAPLGDASELAAMFRNSVNA
jgi:hypothetical protein